MAAQHNIYTYKTQWSKKEIMYATILLLVRLLSYFHRGQSLSSGRLIWAYFSFPPLLECRMRPYVCVCVWARRCDQSEAETRWETPVSDVVVIIILGVIVIVVIVEVMVVDVTRWADQRTQSVDLLTQSLAGSLSLIAYLLLISGLVSLVTRLRLHVAVVSADKRTTFTSIMDAHQSSQTSICHQILVVSSNNVNILWHSLHLQSYKQFCLMFFFYN